MNNPAHEDDAGRTRRERRADKPDERLRQFERERGLDDERESPAPEDEDQPQDEEDGKTDQPV